MWHQTATVEVFIVLFYCQCQFLNIEIELFPFLVRLVALKPRSVCRSVGLSVLQKLQKITKLFKTLQNIKKQ